MNTLREAAQMALEAMSSFESGTGGLYEGEFSAEIAALRAALAIAIWNKAIETAASKAYGVGDEGMYAQIMELKK